MKLIKSSGKTKLTINKSEWLAMGKKEGWVQKQAQSLGEAQNANTPPKVLNIVSDPDASPEELKEALKRAKDDGIYKYIVKKYNVPPNTPPEVLADVLPVVLDPDASPEALSEALKRVQDDQASRGLEVN